MSVLVDILYGEKCPNFYNIKKIKQEICKECKFAKGVCRTFVQCHIYDVNSKHYLSNNNDNMKEKQFYYFATAVPVVTNDDGYLGYLWEGIAYLERTHSITGKDFTPAIKTKGLFYTPDDAIDEAKKMVLEENL